MDHHRASEEAKGRGIRSVLAFAVFTLLLAGGDGGAAFLDREGRGGGFPLFAFVHPHRPLAWILGMPPLLLACGRTDKPVSALDAKGLPLCVFGRHGAGAEYSGVSFRRVSRPCLLVAVCRFAASYAADRPFPAPGQTERCLRRPQRVDAVERNGLEEDAAI